MKWDNVIIKRRKKKSLRNGGWVIYQCDIEGYREKVKPYN